MTEYFVFHKEWNELRKTLSKNAWYELETLMLQLRWDGIDTDPLTIKNQIVRSNWINVRARILNSMKNLNAKKGKKVEQEIKVTPTKNTDITPNEEFDIPTTNNDTTPNTIMTTNLPNNRVDESQITEQKFDNHTETLKDFLDDNIDKIRQSTDIIAKSIAIPNSAMEATAMFYQEKIRQMKEELGTITQDAIDFEKFINEEIERKIREIRYERATA
jgi:hypothetical protein